MNGINQASIYLRVLWFNDNENLRPDNINIQLNGENTEEVVFYITQNNNNVRNNSPWGNVTEWANGITYNYKKEPKIEENLDENENAVIFPNVIPSIVDDITLQNYRKNIIKNAETEEYAYYTIKMTYVPPKRKKMARSTTPTLNFNGTQIENVSFNGTQIDKVVYNGVTVFEKATGPLFKDVILANSTLNEGTPDFSLTATTDEGVFKVADGMYGGNSYYFRGAVTNNYVKFADFCWRIVRINGDGSIRLIYDGTTCHANGQNTAESIAVARQAYNSNYDRSEYVGYTYTEGSQRGTTTASNLKTQTESWYKTNIIDKGFDGRVATGKFCNDREIASGYTWSSQPNSTFYYAAYERLNSAKTPTLNCSTGDVYTLKAGAITADEVAFAGGVVGIANNSYYLYNGQYYWTMSPYSWSGTNAFAFLVGTNGHFTNTYVDNSGRSVRLIINLAPDVQVTGTGTIDDPYIVI